ncbi:MAG: septation protein A [Magnetococcales bacterium]|nr:septation protein A [Magnetococcales bacterium]
MKPFLDLWPVLLFFIVYQWYTIYVATAALMGAVVVHSLLVWWRERRLSPAQLLTLALVLPFGGATLVLHEPRFIQWKPTLLQWLMALAFAGSHFVGQKPLIRRLLDTQVELPPFVWTRLSLAWIGFFVLSGAANLFVAYHFDEATWVSFKLFGLLGMTVLFILLQGVWLARYLPAPPELRE